MNLFIEMKSDNFGIWIFLTVIWLFYLSVLKGFTARFGVWHYACVSVGYWTLHES